MGILREILWESLKKWPDAVYRTIFTNCPSLESGCHPAPAGQLINDWDQIVKGAAARGPGAPDQILGAGN